MMRRIFSTVCAAVTSAVFFAVTAVIFFATSPTYAASAEATSPTCAASVEEPPYQDNFIPWSKHRDELADEYTLEHYGKIFRKIIPRAVVVHWTAGGTLESTRDFFYAETMEDGTLNVASQFVVGRDGTIWRLMPETNFAKHIIGYNHCAIGIENVGGFDGQEDLTAEQLDANVRLIKYLHAKYPTIEYVFGHYQQDAARATGLHIERVKDYYAIKIDPGKIFMRELRKQLEGDGLKFFDD